MTPEWLRELHATTHRNMAEVQVAELCQSEFEAAAERRRQPAARNQSRIKQADKLIELLASAPVPEVQVAH